jgi:hypothetical protein
MAITFQHHLEEMGDVAVVLDYQYSGHGGCVGTFGGRG